MIRNVLHEYSIPLFPLFPKNRPAPQYLSFPTTFPSPLLQHTIRGPDDVIPRHIGPDSVNFRAGVFLRVPAREKN